MNNPNTAEESTIEYRMAKDKKDVIHFLREEYDAPTDKMLVDVVGKRVPLDKVFRLLQKHTAQTLDRLKEKVDGLRPEVALSFKAGIERRLHVERMRVIKDVLQLIEEVSDEN